MRMLIEICFSFSGNGAIKQHKTNSKQGKLGRGAVSVEAYNRMYYELQVDGPITGRASKRQFTVDQTSFMSFEYDRDKGIKQISNYRLSQLRMLFQH